MLITKYKRPRSVAAHQDIWHARGMEPSDRPGYRQERERELEDKLSKAADHTLDEQKLFNESPVEYAKRRLDELLTDAIDELLNLCRFEEDPKIRFTVSKYIIDRAFGSTGPAAGRHVDKEDDPLFNFIDRVTKISGKE